MHSSTQRNSGHRQAIEKRMAHERQLRVEGILDAAQRAFLRNGYVKATMDDIAREAGLTKPTIYQYFKTKEHLFFSLILPIIKELGEKAGEIERNLIRKKYDSGVNLIHDLFNVTYHGYRQSPDMFRMIQIFQQSGDIWKMPEELRQALTELGKRNFDRVRRITEMASAQELIKKYDPFELNDLLYGIFIGLIQLGDIKSHKNGFRKKRERIEQGLIQRLRLAEQLLVDALVLK